MTADNLDAAVAQVAATLTPTRRTSTGAAPGDGSNQVLIRAAAHDHERWKQAAAKCGITMAEFVRQAVNTRTAELLDCTHPADVRRWYPWAEFCDRCGARLRG